MRIVNFVLASVLLRLGGCLPASHVIRDLLLGTPTTTHPCAEISASASSALQATPKDVDLPALPARPSVSAKLAYDCLISVPLNPNDASALVKSIFPYVEWQSDLAYLKNPPSGYLMPPVDVRKELRRVLSNVHQKKYANEHEFQIDLFDVFQSVHDGHFRYVPDLVGAIQFRRTVGIVSVSKDGVEVPKIYIDADIKEYVRARSSTMPSVITHINGQDALEYITETMMKNNLHDPDAQYNNMMYGKAHDAHFTKTNYQGLFALTGRIGHYYPGPETRILFENGTENVYENYAAISAKLDGVTDGSSMYEKVCSGAQGSNETIPEPDIEIESEPEVEPEVPVNIELRSSVKRAFGYPTPEVISADKMVSGYFLEDPAHSDVAVLSILSFQAKSALDFQSVVETMIANAKAAGKTKIIIDLSSNGGGNLLCGYDAFRQFFPQIEQDGFTRIRSHPAQQIISKQLSQRSSNFSLESTDPSDYEYYQTPMNYRYDLNLTNQHFPTYADKFTPQNFNGDNYTSIMRWEMDEPTLTSSKWGVGINITGYGDRKNFSQPFDAENIVMLYDGTCASACTIFSEFMRIQAGVKSIAMGGRPHKGPIQGIGGTKGANSYNFGSLRKLARLALNTGTPDQVASWKLLSGMTDLPIKRSIDTAINFRDIILRDHLEDGIPAQYVYEPADCRLYYEPNMFIDVRAIWRKAASAAWGGADCVAGSLKPPPPPPPPQKREYKQHTRLKSIKLRSTSDRLSHRARNVLAHATKSILTDRFRT
ncbi:hypothetical protein K3495_g4878 [Podosphaera aphanis]|nr:hypothetical protein K3495_g4878 [Podosphaera aphanis]